MKSFVLVMSLTTLVLLSPAFADEEVPPVIDGRTYTQHLIEVAKARYPNIRSIVVTGPSYGSGENVVLGSTLERTSVFSPATPTMASPEGQAGPDGTSYVVRQAYVSSTGRPIGTMHITFAWQEGQPTQALHDAASSIAGRMARATLSDKNAVDPYPYDPNYGPFTYALVLTDRIVAQNPDLVVLMMHVNVPDSDDNVVIGSNIARFGKRADEDDMHVIESGEINLEISSDGERFETELPLLDREGRIIGALGVVFRYKDGDDKEALRTRGIGIRDALASQVPDNAALFAAAP